MNSLRSAGRLLAVLRATCAGCHGADGVGTPVGPNLTTGTWLWLDGSLEALTKTITTGVPVPKQHPAPWPRWAA